MEDTEMVEKVHRLMADKAMVWCAVPHTTPEVVIGVEREQVEKAMRVLHDLPGWQRRRAMDKTRSAVRRAARSIDTLSQKDADGLAADMTLLVGYEIAWGTPSGMFRAQPEGIDFTTTHSPS